MSRIIFGKRSKLSDQAFAKNLGFKSFPKLAKTNKILLDFWLCHEAKPGAKLEGGSGVCDTPPKYKSSGLAGQIIWIGRAMKYFK